MTPPPRFDVIGTAVPKRDGAEKVTGRTRYLHDLALPRLCPACREPVGDSGLCAACWAKLTLIAPPYCERLGIPFAYDPGPVCSPPGPMVRRRPRAHPRIARSIGTRDKEVVVLSGPRAFPAPSRRSACAWLLTVAAAGCLGGCHAITRDVHQYYSQMAVNYKEAEDKARFQASMSESESSIPTMTRSVDASIVVITSAVKPGGVSTITYSNAIRSSE